MGKGQRSCLEDPVQVPHVRPEKGVPAKEGCRHQDRDPLPSLLRPSAVQTTTDPGLQLQKFTILRTAGHHHPKGLQGVLRSEVYSQFLHA